MRYAAGSLIAFFVLGAALLAGCQTAATTTPTTEAKPTVAQTPSTGRSVEYALADEHQAAPATRSADPFTGRYVGSWFDVSGTKGWRQPTEVVFKRSLPDLVTLDYTQGPGFGTDRTPPFSTVWIAHRDKNKVLHPRRNGDTIVLTAEKNTILMERVKANGEVRVSGRLWRVPEDTPDIPPQLAPLAGIWSGRAWSYSYTMEIDVFSEGPHFVVAVDYQYSPIGGWGHTGGGGTFIEHLGPEDPPSMRLFKTLDVVLQNESRLLIEYQVRTARHSVTLKKKSL